MSYYKINYNGKGGCHLKVVERDNLHGVLLDLLNNGMNVHYVSAIRT